MRIHFSINYQVFELNAETYDKSRSNTPFIKFGICFSYMVLEKMNIIIKEKLKKENKINNK